jgi:endoglucanase
VAAGRVAVGGGAAGDVVAVAPVQEEIGLFGAMTSAFGLEPDVAIAVDVTHATDVPGVDKHTEGEHALGSGAVIARGSTLHPLVSDLLCDAAEAEDVPFTIEASGRGTGTDADSVHTTRAGIPTGLVSIPLRYMHSSVEVVQLTDVEACAKLVAAFARRLTAETAFVRG